MKRLWLILFVIPIFAQSPCEDETFVELSKRNIDEGIMSKINPSISGEEFDY